MNDVHIKLKTFNTQHTNQSLDEIMSQNEIEPKLAWNKLDKSIKLFKLNQFVDEFKILHDLTNEQVVELKTLLKDKINHKQLQKSKDVVYDIESGTIKSIPNLTYNSPNFIFKLVERASPLNSLTPKNKTIRHNK